MTTKTITITPEDTIYSPAYGTITVAEAAQKAAGNWMHEGSFVWFSEDRYDYPEDWMHYAIETRDSEVMEASNAATIRRWMEERGFFDDGSVVEESHSHWACGYVEKLIVRVYDRVMQDGSPLPEDSDDRYDDDGNDRTQRGPISQAFLFLCEIMNQISDYPVLDEDDYYTRKTNIGVGNVKDALYNLVSTYGETINQDNLPNDWEYMVYDILQESGQKEEDDYPDSEEMFEAFLELGYINPEYLDQDQRREYEINKRALEIKRDESVTQHSFVDGVTAYDIARAELAHVVWEQKGLE